MRRRDKIVVLGGLIGVVLGVVIGIVVAKRETPEEGVAATPTDGKKLIKVGTALIALVRLIQDL
ncbi:MAG: hypothetical protein ABFD20_07725 [Anaerolineales bacterium]